MPKLFLPGFPIIFNSALQELHIISLYVERMCNLMDFQMKNFQQKSEKAEGEKSDGSEVLELKTEQVSTKMKM